MAKHEGWVNIQTWSIALWIDNTQASQEFWREQATAAWDKTGDKDEAVSRLALWVSDAHEEAIDSLHLEGFAADLMTYALDDVSWREVAEHLLSGLEG